MVVYPPQVEDWQGYQTIDFRMAFSLKPVNQTKQVVGVVYINAATVMTLIIIWLVYPT